MKTSTVRELRYSFSRIVRWLKAGESIEITYRGKKLASMIPAGRIPKAAPIPPDFESRLKRLFPQGARGKSASRIIIDDRGGM